MDSNYKYYALYMAFMFIVNLLVVAAPVLALYGQDGASKAIYTAYVPFCHQLPSRSLCIINSPEHGVYIDDCVKEDTKPIDRYTYSDSRGTEYAFAVCARDMPLYLMMFIAGLAYPLMRRIDTTKTPPLWFFLLAVAPLAIDGLLQLWGFHESSNLLRIITGTLAGIAVPFYAIPLLYYFIPILNDAFLRKR
ncbi:hypothetical protein DRN67_02055 [Candidatus Micrarchaeota archaeon]|nr:MAG: hypothetical protein DRN67_02055 [Candidatus Micrarchaeota archaeon]